MTRSTEQHTSENDRLSSIAMKRYNARYDNHVFSMATDGKTSWYANALIDEALALCGDPYYSPSKRRYCKEAQAFLALFSTPQTVCNVALHPEGLILHTEDNRRYVIERGWTITLPEHSTADGRDMYRLTSHHSVMVSVDTAWLDSLPTLPNPGAMIYSSQTEDTQTGSIVDTLACLLAGFLIPFMMYWVFVTPDGRMALDQVMSLFRMAWDILSMVS
jgi:hypothetical protein